MLRRALSILALGALALAGVLTDAGQAQAADTPLPRFNYYPYYYFPHSYWPSQSPRWPEQPGEPYMRPPAYQAYPPFAEPWWRYEFLQPQRYYRGHHFWLDQF